MSLHIAPFSKSDLTSRFKGQVVSSQSIRNKTDTHSHNSVVRKRTDAHRRYYINLGLPVINTVLCGERYQGVAALLGAQAMWISEIANFTRFYNKVTGESVHRVDIGESYEDYLFGGQYLEFLIEGLNCTERIKRLLQELVLGKINIKEGVTITENSGTFALLGNWFITCDEPTAELVKTKKAVEYVQNKYIAGKLRTLQMLINLHNNCGDDEQVREYLKGLLVSRVLPVIPCDMRPALKERDHSLTTAYIELYNTCNRFSSINKGNITDFIDYYKLLSSLYSSITCSNLYRDVRKNGVMNNDRMSNVISILDSMKGKTGHIRKNLISKRQDYSGRTAVVVNPFMPVNTVGVPKSMIRKLYSYHLLSDCNLSPDDVVEMVNSVGKERHIIHYLEKNGVLSDIPIMIGRQPSLHRHSIQGFHVKPVDGSALEMSPLVCPAYNMDFDGDTAHDNVMLSPKACEEVTKLIMTDRNAILPKTGECTIMPRMDIIYGLYMCTRSTYSKSTPVSSYVNSEELLKALKGQKIYVWDTVSLEGRGTDLAGVLAFESCFPKKLIDNIGKTPEITASTIKPYIRELVKYSRETFCSGIDALVNLGMSMAYLYSTSVSMCKPLITGTESTDKFDTAYKTFVEDMKEIDELNDLGFYDEESYSTAFSTYYQKLSDTLKKNVFAKLDEDNMFKCMAVSGARGNAGNLVQLFGMKGRVQKSASEVFNVVINHSLSEQLTPIESAIAAQGARGGQIAKSINTADTGYLERKLAHAAFSIIIREDDCGTTEGIEVRKSDILKYIGVEIDADEVTPKQESEATEILEKYITGRYLARDNVKVTPELARALAREKDAVIKIRSPLTCKNPCCRKCYGNDTSTSRDAAVGLAIGVTAAQSLGEPLSQLTMKLFQRGGVAGGLSSPFDRVSAMFSQADIARGASEGKYMSYDPIAWVNGTLVAEEGSQHTVVMRIIPDDPEVSAGKSIIVKGSIDDYRVGKHVKVGETLSKVRGDCYSPEVIATCGILEAQQRMLYTLYFAFRSEVDVLPIHFEVMVLAMTGYLPVTSSLKEIRLGSYYTKWQLAEIGADENNTFFIPDLLGIQKVLIGNVNFMEAMIVERQRDVLSNAVLNGLSDTFSSPFVQLAFGHVPKLGTGYNENFMEERNG